MRRSLARSRRMAGTAVAARSRRLGGIVLAGALTALTGAVVTASNPGPAFAGPSATGEFNYAEALQESMLFYESQRSGKLPADNRVSWRGDSDLNDGADHGIDLTGGYHDAGDEVKFGLPAAYSMTTLAWGGLANPDGYADSGQTRYLLRNLKWGDDYIIKAHPSPHVFYGQVGDGGSDHAFWGPPEVNPSPRPSYAVTESCPGSDLTGQSAAALAASYLLFKDSDPSYAATLLTHAKSLYEFADDYRGKYDQCITAAQGYYNSWSGYWDELVWGAIWLYKATGDQTYLDKAEQYYGNMNKMNQTDTPEYNWTINWDDTSFGSYVLMAELTGDQKYIDDAERNLDWFTSSVDGNHVNFTPGGEAVVDVWGTLRYAANAAFLALEFSNWLRAQGKDTAKAQAYHDFGVRQINYILGDNPNHLSYEVGFTNGGTNTAWPRNVHSRGAHGSWTNNINNPVNNRHTAIGELVGGPNSAGSDAFSDDRNNYQQNEGALDYNALFSGALAELTEEYGGTPLADFPPVETPDGPEMLVQASLNASGSNFFEIKALVENKSAWPARASTDMSFRYYFTLDPGVSADDLSFSSAYNQCSDPTSATHYSGSIYYVTLSCAGQRIAPSGQSDFKREIQFRIIFPGAHDFTQDYSFAGLPSTPGATPVNAKNIVLYDGDTQVWGTPPGQQQDTPPGAPGAPTASGVTADSATLTWNPATPGSNPIAGYDVYQGDGASAVKVASTGAGTTSVTVTGLSPATTYTFSVVARDTAGSTSPRSPSTTVTTQPATSPSPSVSPSRTASPSPSPSPSHSPSPSPSRSSSPTPSTTPPPASGCRVDYAVQNDWGAGFTTTITITNTGSATIDGWTLDFTFPGNQNVTQGWSAAWMQTGPAVTATNLSWNGTLAPGGSTSIGFNGAYSGTNTDPSSFTLNGSTCTIVH